MPLRKIDVVSGVGSTAAAHAIAVATVYAIAITSVLAPAFFPPLVFAQDDDAAAERPLVMDGLPLDETVIEARLGKLRADQEMPAETRSRAIASYETALANLAAAASLERKATSFEQARADAPQTLAELRRELTRAPAEPEIDADRPLSELEDMARAAETDLLATRSLLAKIEGEQNKRSRKRLESPQLIAEATHELAEIDGLLRSLPKPRPDDETVVAQRAELLARREVALARLDVNDKEMASYDARRDLLAAKREQTLRRSERLEDRVRRLQSLVAASHRNEAERQADLAEDAVREYTRLHPALRKLAKHNGELAAVRSGPEGLATQIQQARADLNRTTDDLERIASRFTAVREKVDAVGFTPPIGLLLRKERTELPDAAAIQRAMRDRQDEIGRAQFEMIQLEEERDELGDLETAVWEVMTGVEHSMEPARRREIEDAARELILTKRGYIDSLIDDYDTYFGTLVELDAKQRDLITAAREYGGYIDENVLWIRGPAIVSRGGVNGTRTAEGLRQAFTWLTRKSNPRRLGEGVEAAVSMRPLTTVAAVMAWLALFTYRRRIRAALDALCPGRAKALSMGMRQTFQALLLAALAAGLWPALLRLAAFLVSGAEGAGGAFGQAVGAGLTAVARVFFVAELVRRVAKPGGVGEVHLGWSPARMEPVRRGLAQAMVFGLPALFVVTLLDAQRNDLFKASLGRVAFVVGAGAAAVAAWRTFHPRNGVMAGLRRRADAPWLSRLLDTTHVFAAAVPAALVVMAVSGYDFAAQSLARKLWLTSVVALILVLAHACVVRWLVLARRRLALRQAWERETARAQADEGRAGDGEPALAAEAEALDLTAVNAQTRRLVGTFVVASFLIGTWMIWHDVLPALRAFERVELWHVTQQVDETVETEGGSEQRTLVRQRAITAADLSKALVIVLLAFIAGRNIPGFLEITILQQLPLDAGIRYAITSVSRYVIAVLGTVLAVAAVGVSWSKVQWLVAAITVGLGFGLQEIFANFVSGLIILFERPIRVGDVVTLGDQSGVVSRIRIRATTIVNGERKELIVPNKEFITGRLVNWTLTDPTLRTSIPIGVAYGSDTALVERLLLKCALDCELVLRDPPPSVSFASFGESALNFQIGFFVAAVEHEGRAKHAVSMAIDREFRMADIEIAYPQRDLRVRTPIEVSVRNAREDAVEEPLPQVQPRTKRA